MVRCGLVVNPNPNPNQLGLPCFSVLAWLMCVLTDPSSDLLHTFSPAEGGPVKTGVRKTVAKPAVDGAKTDKMEETLTCVICQDLLHDCIRFATFI